jgi:hypothetical protein
MSRIPALLTWTAALWFLAAAAAQEATPPPDYYPLKVGSKWNYKMEVNGNPVKCRTEITKVETIDGKKLHRLDVFINDKVVAASEHLSANEKGVFRNRISGLEADPPLCLIKHPATKGATWTEEVRVGAEKVKANCVAGEEEIKVPAGSYKALTVDIETTANNMKVTTKYWFVKGVGVVKQIYKMGEVNVSMELESFQGVN